MIGTESFPGEEGGDPTKDERVAELTKRMHEEVDGLGGDPRFVWLQGRVSYEEMFANASGDYVGLSEEVNVIKTIARTLGATDEQLKLILPAEEWAVDGE